MSNSDSDLIKELLLNGNNLQTFNDNIDIKIPEIDKERLKKFSSNKGSIVKKGVITALDIDNNNKTIIDNVNLNTIQYNKNRITKAQKDQRDFKRVELNDVNYQLTSEEKEEINNEIINDKETLLFQKNEFIFLQNSKDNYYEVRQTINEMNDINEFSAEIERIGLQRIDNFLNYAEVIEISLQNVDKLKLMISTRKKLFQLIIDNYKQSTLDINNIDEIINNIQNIYKINTDIDDIELYEKYNLETNIDKSNQLSDICLKRLSFGDSYTNSINKSLIDETSIISQLKKESIIDNKLLGILLASNNNSTCFVSNNLVTCMETMYVNNLNNKKLYCTRTIGELLYTITDKNLASLDKAGRQQIYCTYDGKRPQTTDYHKWNGLQIYDIDLKLWKGNIDYLKQKMFDILKDFHWFLWICKSASGKGIHVYTKVSAPHHIFTNIEDNEYISKYWYAINYSTKLSTVYDCLHRLHKSDKNIFFEDGDETFENVFVDNSVGRITSGIRLTYDNHPLVNHSFTDLHPGIGLSQTIDGFTNQTTINNVFYRNTKYNQKIIKLINTVLRVDNVKDTKIKVVEEIDLKNYVSIGNDLASITSLPRNSINYTIRYNVCNTLAAIFGTEGLHIAHSLLSSEACGNVGEINSFYSCAMSNAKNPSKLGLEILKKSGIIKTIKPEIQIQVENEYKSDLKHQIEQTLTNTFVTSTFDLGPKEYISHKTYELERIITGEKINMVFSPPGSGKTQFILNLAKMGKRILLVLPYISVITNKVETDKDITELFDTYYGAKNIADIEYGRNAVTTFDKFSKANYEKIGRMFDYIFIDESHLLFTSSYRIEATSNAIKKIKDLFFMSSNDSFSAKIVLLTGTETGESYFFGQIANTIIFTKKSHHKQMEFLICDDTLDAITRLSSKAAEFINSGYRLMIPTNKGEIYSEKIIGMVQHILNRTIKYGYYKRANTEQEICKLINSENSIGDYDIVFCSNYLSVGVDINDSIDLKTGEQMKFASLYFGNFSGYEIEQFNARIRRIGIKSIYCITTNNNDGTTNKNLLEEPNLVLRITDDDQLFFIDDKSIAAAKQEFIASYDPILRRIVTPGFGLLNGKIQFNLEEYELLSFETKYNECMEHPLKVARELAKYGYDISVSTEFEGLTQVEQNELKKIGIDSARQEKIRKHNLLVGTFIDLIKCNRFISVTGIEFNDVIAWIGKNTNKIVEDRNIPNNEKDEEVFLYVEHDLFGTPSGVIIKSREAFDKMYKSAKYLSKKYSEQKSIDIIYQYTDETGILKQKYFNRAIALLKLIDSSDAGELADPIISILGKMYDFVDKFEASKTHKISYDVYRNNTELWTNDYIQQVGIKINTVYGFEKVQNGIIEMLSSLATKQTSKAGIRYTYNKLPDQDSTFVLNRRSVDTLVESMFKITDNVQRNGNKIKSKHVILATQTF